MTPETDSNLVPALQAKFAHFSRNVFADDPLYAALTAAAAERADFAALLAAAPAPQQLPLLWLAALQDRVLERVDRGDRPELADYYASADWTDGCIALSNSDMVEVWLMTQDNVRVEILP